MTTDLVGHPPHYQTDSGLEAIEVIDAFFRENHYLATVFKYIARTGKKDDPVQDLRKAEWYLRREIARLMGESDEDVKSDGFVYEFAGRVTDLQIETQYGMAQDVGLSLATTSRESATHSIRFKLGPGSDVADLFLGKPTVKVDEPTVKPKSRPFATGPFPTGLRLFRTGDRVRIISDHCTKEAGTIGEIIDGPDSDGDYAVKTGNLGGGWCYASADDLELAPSPEDVPKFQVGERVYITSLPTNTYVGFGVGDECLVEALSDYAAPELRRLSDGLPQTVPKGYFAKAPRDRDGAIVDIDDIVRYVGDDELYPPGTRLTVEKWGGHNGEPGHVLCRKPGDRYRVAVPSVDLDIVG